ncbi:Uncharacterized protein FWK35_00002614 [Aphis craccivora]|uniref:Uncharacterized protein n=1 Tax=Aphis craccivora TaxID=307492 RepID=A0A6G0ZLW1_APHCR|nr:Uncharacterized protein FWK35_00002614 [Aphis craccivora]
MKNCFNDFVIVLWPMTVNSHNENNILKRISRSNNSSLSISSITTTISTGKAENNTLPKMNDESNVSIASSTSSTPNDFQTTLSPGISLQNKNINDVDTFQNTLPDQNYGYFVIIVFFSAMLILILGLLFIVMYKKQGNSFYQVRGIRRRHQETQA